MTKASDLKILLIWKAFEKWMQKHVTQNKTKYFLHFFTIFLAFFQPPPSNQTIKVINQIIFFNELALKNWTYISIQPYTFSPRPFSKGGFRVKNKSVNKRFFVQNKK